MNGRNQLRKRGIKLMGKVISINEIINENKAAVEYEKNVELIIENMNFDNTESVLHLDYYIDGDEIEWWEDTILRYEINEMDLCYDVLTMDVIKFENKYKPLIWSEAAEYVFYYLKSFKEDDEYDEFSDFFERLRSHGEKRKLESFDTLKNKKKWEHIKSCLAQGKKGVMQLVDERIEKGFTNTDVDMFNHFIETVELYKKTPYQIFKDAVSMNAYVFYKKHEWNWYMAVSETIYFLATLKWADSDKYEESLEIITNSIELNKV